MNSDTRNTNPGTLSDAFDFLGRDCPAAVVFPGLTLSDPLLTGVSPHAAHTEMKYRGSPPGCAERRTG
jgi:hypothetical protein